MSPSDLATIAAAILVTFALLTVIGLIQAALGWALRKLGFRWLEDDDAGEP